MSKISSNIKKFRTKSGMTQEDLAFQIHVTRQTVSSWETGRTQPDLQILQALSDAFGIEIEELIYGKRKNTAEEKEKLIFGNTLVTVISVLGCLLIGAGVVMIFIKFWRDFPDILKLCTCFIPALLGQGTGIYTYIKKKDSMPWCEGACVLWMLGTCVTTSVLMSQLNPYVISDSFMYLFFTVSALVLMFLFRTLSPLAVIYICGSIWFNTFLNDSRIYTIDKNDTPADIGIFVTVSLILTVLLITAFYCSSQFYKKEVNIIRYSFASWINFLGLAVFIGCFISRTQLDEGIIPLLIFAAIICFIVGLRHTDFISPYRVLGLPASAAAVCFLGIILSLELYAEQWINILMLVAGLVPFALLLWKKTKPQNIYLQLYAALLTGALFVYNVISIIYCAFSSEDYYERNYEFLNLIENCLFSVSFFLSLAALIILIIYGARERKLFYLNTGFILACFIAIARLYLLDLGLIFTGLLLIICGAGLLFINLKISRLREKERLTHLNEGEEDVQ